MSVGEGAAPPGAVFAPALDAALDRIGAARRLLALFDIDGTLAPIAPRPELAVVPPATRAALAALAALPDVHVGLVTGRAARDGARLVGVGGVWVVGNHGAETHEPSGAAHVAPGARAHADAVARARVALEAAVAPVAGAFVEDKRWSLSLHVRQASADAVPTLRDTAAAVAAREGLRLADGKAVLELRPPVAIDKGTATRALADRLALGPADAVLFVGDDVTDEDAFRALPGGPAPAVTIRVGGADVPTAAAHRLADPDAVRALLEALVVRRTAGTG